MLSKNQLKNIIALHSRKVRSQEGLFIVEGEKMLDELLMSSFDLVEIFGVEEWIKFNREKLEQKKIRHTIIDETVLKKISLLTTPNKVLAIARQQHQPLQIELLRTELNLYLDGIRDPGNLGTIIRLAHWFGVKQVICSDDCVELYNPKVVQSTMGSIFKVCITEMSLEDTVSSLGPGEINVFGALLDGDNIYKKDNFNSGILVIGNESNGISEKNFPFITDKVKIPPASENHAESLNAAMATSVFLSEYLRKKKYF